VAEVAEAQGGAAQVLEPAVDGLGRAVAGAGPVEVGQHVRSPPRQGPAEGDELGKRGRDTAAQAVDERAEGGLAAGAVGLPEGSDDPLVDAPGDRDR